MTLRQMVNDECHKRGMPSIAAEAVMAGLEIKDKKSKGHWDDSVDLTDSGSVGPWLWIVRGFDRLEEELYFPQFPPLEPLRRAA